MKTMLSCILMGAAVLSYQARAGVMTSNELQSGNGVVGQETGGSDAAGSYDSEKRICYAFPDDTGAVPEPATVALLGIGLGAYALRRRYSR